MLDRIITYCFYLLFFFTPLIWAPFNFELFEYNKMTFVYLITIVITTVWILKMVSLKKLLIKRTPLDLPLLIFLGANILSTIFSLDPHTSLFGYYSRSNGGLLSVISYVLLYFALVSNFSRVEVPKFLKAALLGGLIVSLYAIPEHFGVSPSCVILHHQFSADCWVQDVKNRVFATLGQPNWLASYLGMLIFPASYFLLTAASKAQAISYTVLAVIYYLAFTFTYSRGATLGLIGGFMVFLIFYFLQNTRKTQKTRLSANQIIRTAKHWFAESLILRVILIFLIINLLFGSALTRFQISQFLSQTTTSSPSQTSTPTALTQLENGGTESGQIRLIVWQGAIDIFKHYPLLGSGVETFAYIYYQYRPPSHNLVSEWDFLYNKAHNEYLNYLATTGIVGFGTYLFLIGTFLFWSMRRIYNEKSKNNYTSYILYSTLLASYISYLIQNLVGFSVVMITLLFFSFPALSFIFTEEPKLLKIPNFLQIPPLKQFSTSRVTQSLVVLVGILLIFTVLKNWSADIIFAQGDKASNMGEITQAYSKLLEAVSLNPHEPLYKSELGYAQATMAVALRETDATLSGQLKDAAALETENVLKAHPHNISFYHTAVRTYYLLSSLDPTFTEKTLKTVDEAIKLSPTNPKLFYNKAVILDQNEEAINNLKQAIKLKNNYREAYLALGLFYFDEKNYPEAVANLNKVLKLVPGDSEALQYLNDWGKKGIATESASQL